MLFQLCTNLPKKKNKKKKHEERTVSGWDFEVLLYTNSSTKKLKVWSGNLKSKITVHKV